MIYWIWLFVFIITSCQLSDNCDSEKEKFDHYIGESFTIYANETLKLKDPREDRVYKLWFSGPVVDNRYTLDIPFPDFVFKEDYVLKSINEVENFINDNGHLPDIPSESDVLENGLSIGKMQAKLLQKIEELTLYVIELDKKNKQLEAMINNN